MLSKDKENQQNQRVYGPLPDDDDIVMIRFTRMARFLSSGILQVVWTQLLEVRA